VHSYQKPLLHSPGKEKMFNFIEICITVWIQFPAVAIAKEGQ
jgi:hypothetical protein